MKKLPSMHHQFKELAGVDISKEPMEVGPTAHYVMGGVLVDAETQESTVSGLLLVERLHQDYMEQIVLEEIYPT